MLNPPVIPKNKSKARHQYGNGKKNELPRVSLPRNLVNVQSKIKGHIAYFKEMSRGRSNQPLFNKEPVVYYKENPGDMGYDHEPTPHDNSRKVK